MSKIHSIGVFGDQGLCYLGCRVLLSMTRNSSSLSSLYFFWIVISSTPWIPSYSFFEEEFEIFFYFLCYFRVCCLKEESYFLSLVMMTITIGWLFDCRFKKKRGKEFEKDKEDVFMNDFERSFLELFSKEIVKLFSGQNLSSLFTGFKTVLKRFLGCLGLA